MLDSALSDSEPSSPRGASAHPTRSAKDAPIRLERLVKDYGRFRALNQVSCVIEPGVTGLLGPNGAGKTTLIKVLLGLVRLTSGSGSVLGAPLGKGGREIRERVGYLPEDDCYIAGLSGVEMVRFGARLSGIGSLEALRRAHEILDFCGIEQERYREVDTYSTGMRQRLRFAMALVADPELLILDEPTATLDPEERVAMLHRIRVLARDFGKTVLISTHILPDVQTLCDAVVIVARGEVRLADRMERVNRPSAPMYQLALAAPCSALLESLAGRGIDVRPRETGGWELWGVTQQTVGDVWRAALATGAEIRALTPARNSLEEVFLQAIQDQKGQPAPGSGSDATA